MSLPSKMLFMKNGEVVKEMFVNCGWFFEKDKLVGYIFDAISEYCIHHEITPTELSKEVDYDFIVLYGFVVRKSMLQKHLSGDLTKEQFLETISEDIYGIIF